MLLFLFYQRCLYFQMIPSRDGSKKEKLKPLSASDERKIDEAMELASEFAQLSTSDHMISSPRSSHSEHPDSDHSGTESPKGKSMFGLGRKRSPKPERRSFCEEIASLSSDLNEEVTPEAQEAYNMLVVKGKAKDSKPRDRRMRRSLDHQRQSPEPPPVAEKPVRNGRTNVNANIREPQGIPRPGPALRQASAEVDSNPLRRLRDSQSFMPKPRFSRPTDLRENGHSSVPPEPANLNPNLSFFAKLKEQEEEREMEVGDSVGENPPVPPRIPIKPSTINSKPRQRKHPLNLTNYDLEQSEINAHSRDEQPAGKTQYDVTPTKHQLPPTPPLSNGKTVALGETPHNQNTGCESDDSVFTESDCSSPIEKFTNAKLRQKPKFTFPLVPSPQGSSSVSNLSVKSVKLSAVELGINDNSDSFWSQKVNFEEMAGSESPTSDLGLEHSPIPGRYKTSDNVSYEDLMEFALDSLDGADPRCVRVTLCYIPFAANCCFWFDWFTSPVTCNARNNKHSHLVCADTKQWQMMHSRFQKHFTHMFLNIGALCYLFTRCHCLKSPALTRSCTL